MAPPPHWTPAWLWLLSICYQILSINKKYQIFGAACIISTSIRISFHFLVFDLKTVSHWLILNLSSQINLYICYFLGVLQYNHLMLRLPDNLRRITRNIIRIIGRLGGKQGYAPYFQELTHYLGLRRPITIKKLL